MHHSSPHFQSSLLPIVSKLSCRRHICKCRGSGSRPRCRGRCCRSKEVRGLCWDEERGVRGEEKKETNRGIQKRRISGKRSYIHIVMTMQTPSTILLGAVFGTNDDILVFLFTLMTPHLLPSPMKLRIHASLGATTGTSGTTSGGRRGRGEF